MTVKLLIVEDEEKILALMETFLRSEGYTLYTARDGVSAVGLYADHRPDLIVLDWMLPGMSGLDACRRFREMGEPGIIMVTAKTEETDKIVGLEMGADDYLTKPFSLRELAARIRSLLRRMNRLPGSAPQSVLRRGELAIHEESLQVFKGGQELRLTPTEFRLLHLLASKPGRVYSRMQLLQHAFEEEFVIDERTVDSHISKLRKKIGDDPEQPVYIRTVYGFGYRFGAGHEN
ncbi:DNA-binding response regulator [Paenibacillus chitinolyticus]|uniref:DNA-binding response regulator n=1 Tax=Paenibacillus chitinolyticus TaxID=79263 RepID=A0A410X5C1_9BACL|nr:response regulator transcription factor [Paenibacillus chitinolyticus]MCY9591169.1 response regulator transcription factor [Paenibacillus chitinolyticus]MCY9596690.1 response regulator transcription factor [Paenibacillus chitinolyticus]QAV21810.1 DNA-binding response regulator [Paenibacillus chitinolyticus]